MTVTLFLAFLLSACGFSPLYGEHAQVPRIETSFKNVEIANIPDREGQYLRNKLVDRLYANAVPDASPRYTLSLVHLRKNVFSIGVRKDATSTRGQIDIDARLRLIDTKDNTIVLDRALQASGGYNRLDNLDASLVSEEDATNRVLEELADSTVTELSLFFARNGEPRPAVETFAP